ncbi:MAG: hypothetical protein ACRDPK_10310, partial [Carbonactinosporaceae bacterium]
MVLSLGVVLTRYVVADLLPKDVAEPIGPLSHVSLDVMLGIPVAAAAVWLAGRTMARLGLPADPWDDQRSTPALTYAAVLSLVFTALTVPLAVVQGAAHLLVGGTHHGSGAASLDTFAGFAGQGLQYALLAQPVVLALAWAATAVRIRPRSLAPPGRLRSALASASAAAIAAALLPAQVVSLASPASAAPDVTSAAAGQCDTAPQRSYDVVAMNVDITVNRFGDHDPFGFMYALAGRETAIRQEEAALKDAARGVGDAKVQNGLRDDLIQPLVLRARLGECLVINLTNKLTQPPTGGPGFTANPIVTQPGGVPDVSFDLQGVSYDAAGGDGGAGVGNNPANVMVPPGGSHTYRFFLDPSMGEGGRVFRSGGDSEQLTAHGLFGAVIAEPAGARWFDPETGTEQTGNANWNNWEAMIQEPREPSFREFSIIYHEIGDENFNMRRPPKDPIQILQDP